MSGIVKRGLSLILENVLKIKLPTMLTIGFLLTACQTSIAPEFGMVNWYLVNGTNNRMSLNVYDKVCRKTHFRVQVSTTTDTPISTCANSAGRAEVRYQRVGGYSITENPVHDDIVDQNQSLYLQ